jgi:hypothetical protein
MSKPLSYLVCEDSNGLVTVALGPERGWGLGTSLDEALDNALAKDEAQQGAWGLCVEEKR